MQNQREFIKLTKSQHFSKKHQLEDLGSTYGSVKGRSRCQAHGLQRGGCYLTHLKDGPYCYYHDKIYQGLLDPDEIGLYPVWPLPKWGYRFA